jgi:spore coat polysaccharide biosynthesis protein SpsF
MSKRKLVACLACRNKGTRLYGKPLQNLDIENRLTVLDYMITAIKGYSEVHDIVLAISEGIENLPYIDIANNHQVKYIIGNEEDVLNRLIDACEFAGGTDIFRVTTESPFTFYEMIANAWIQHINRGADLTALDNLPDGAGFEITKLSAYKKAWHRGNERHRSELCSLFIRENKSDFKIDFVEIEKIYRRVDIRLTIDYPEDLILCRAVYTTFKDKAPYIPLKDIITFLDENPSIKSVCDPFVAEGLRTMYL